MADQISQALSQALSKIPDLKSRFEAADKDLGLPLIGSHECDDASRAGRAPTLPHPDAQCNAQGTGVSCPVGVLKAGPLKRLRR